MVASVKLVYDYLTVRMMVSASGRAALLRSNAAGEAVQERRRDVLDWISPPILVSRSA